MGLFFYLDRGMRPPQWSDLGMYMQTVMLLARAQGLHACAQEIWSLVPATVRECVGAPAHRMLFAGMALRHADPAHPLNALRTARAPLEEFAHLQGFDAV